MIDVIAWFVAAFLAVLCLSLARRLVETQEELRIEKRLCWQAEQRAEQSERTCRRLADKNFALAKKTAMYFAGQPTLDATAYGVEGQPVTWWTYDN